VSAKASTASTFLVDARRSTVGTIVSLPEDQLLRSQCIRLGIIIGARFKCIERLPGGTIVLETHRQEIALGRVLAGAIGVAMGERS
jgi:Fe2+ transport system protein FeoA